MATKPVVPGLCYDSDASRPGPWVTTVHDGETCILTACGLKPGEEFGVFKHVAGMSCPAKLIDGSPAILSAESCVLVLSVPGKYELVPRWDPTSRVVVECLCMDNGAVPLTTPSAPVNKPQIIDGLTTLDGCAPAWIEIPCGADGRFDQASAVAYTVDTETSQIVEIPMSQTVGVGAAPQPQPDKENLSPFSIVGPAAAQPLNDIIDAALAASLNTDFDKAGVPVTADDIKECGSITIMTKDGSQGIVIAGDTANPVASWTWSGGISGLDTIEVLDGCEVWANACAETTYIPAKA